MPGLPTNNTQTVCFVAVTFEKTGQPAKADAALAAVVVSTWWNATVIGVTCWICVVTGWATSLEDVGSPFIAYGGKSLRQQSHGEAFLSLFQHRLEDGLYLLDEPEAALSPQRQLAFLLILHDLTAQKISQFVIATHSPMLLTFPGATISCSTQARLKPITANRE
jgi:predicted ATPase